MVIAGARDASAPKQLSFKMAARLLLAAIAGGGVLSLPTVALAQRMSAQALADKVDVEDLITRYYNNFGGGVESRVGEFYSSDAEMILGGKSYKGIDAIKGAYAAVPTDAPQRRSFSLNILINNMLVKVTGKTATARMVFTETVIEKQGDAPKLLIQGREFDWLVKRNGRWLISKRQILGPKGVPDGWQD